MNKNCRRDKNEDDKVARRLQRRGIKTDSEELEEVSEYTCLGRLITPGNEMNKENKQRITMGWKGFGNFLKEKKMPL